MKLTQEQIDGMTELEAKFYLRRAQNRLAQFFTIEQLDLRVNDQKDLINPLFGKDGIVLTGNPAKVSREQVEKIFEAILKILKP